MALDFFAGCVGGCAGVIIGHPLDTVKVKIQTQDFRNPKYKGTWHCFSTIAKTESVRGLYRGVTSPMAGVSMVNAVVFGVYGNLQRRIGGGLGGQALAGAAAGAAQAFVCSPMELAKTRLQLQQHPVYRGALHCLTKVAKEEGIRGVFKGLGVTVAREVPAFGTYFVVYEYVAGGQQEAGTGRMLLGGGLAGTASWIVSYPMDVVKSRLQADGFQDLPKYTGAMDCLRKSLASDGYKVLFRGLNSTIIRAFPTNAVTFATVTWVFRLARTEPLDTPSAQLKHSEHKITVKLKDNLKNKLPYYEDGRIDMC